MDHIWLVLSDSALPLGSFAFSSGLESFNIHASSKSSASVTRFLRLSLASVSCSILPFLVATFNSPFQAIELDDEIDASTTCEVARRASVNQGRALLTIWDRALKGEAKSGDAIAEYSLAVRNGEAKAHWPIVWGLVCAAFDLELDDVCYVFMFNYVKAILSAAVRLGLMGPYHSHSILALQETRTMIRDGIVEGMKRKTGDTGQPCPSLDIYQGRHELLYSRVFNS